MKIRMKKLKPCFSTFLCIVLCAVMLCGCGKKETGKEAGNPPDGGDTFFGDANGQEPSGGRDGDAPDGDLKDGGGAKGESGESPKDGTVSGVKFELLENYKEKNIPSVYQYAQGKEHFCNVLINRENKIEFYTYNYEEGSRHFFKYTLVEDEAGTTWEREALPWCDSFGKEIGEGDDWVKVFVGEDGNDYAWYLGTDENAHLVKRVENYSVEIMGLDWGYSNFIEPAVLENGNIVMANLGRECSVYDPADGSVLERFRCGFYLSLCVAGNQIYIGDSLGSSVQHYDAEKKEFAETLTAGFDTTIRTAVSGDDVYVCNMHGIYRAKTYGGQFQKVLDAGTYHFANDSTNLWKFFVIGDSFYVAYGEDGCSIKKYFPAGEDDVAEKSLEVYSLKTNDVILDMISEFQDMYPDTKIIYETGEGADGSVTTADSIRALNTRILAGDGPDILLMDQIPADSYFEKGLLADLSPVLGDLKDELTENILSVYTVDGKIRMLPARFKVPMILACGQEEEQYNTLRALVEYSEENGGVMRPGYTHANIFEMLYYNYPPKLISEEQTVNKDAVSEFLELFKRLCISEKADSANNWPGTYLSGLNPANFYAQGNVDFEFITLTGGYSLGVYPEAVKRRGGQMLPCRRRFYPNTLVAINALSKKQELAGDFVRFVFSYKTQERTVWSSGYPIHKTVLDEFAALDMSKYISGGGDFWLRDSGPEENAKMIAYVKKVDEPFMPEGYLWDIMMEGAMEYLNGKQSLEASVEAVVGRIQLYIYEQ